MRNWYSFAWICGDQIVEQHLHNLDTATGSWARIRWRQWHPAAPHGVRATEEYGNIYDHVCADFVYPNGVHMASRCRQYRNPTANNVSELIIGTKGRMDSRELRGGRLAHNPYEQEHTDLVNSILGAGRYINEAMSVAESTMTAIMGREAAYSGQRITWDMMMQSTRSLMPTDMRLQATFPMQPLAAPGEYQFA